MRGCELGWVRLVLVGVEGPVNLGFIARLADNFGVGDLVLVDPSASPVEAARYAARAAGRLERARVVDALDDALEGTSLALCTSARYSGDDVLRIAIPSWAAAELATAYKALGPVALVMGRESTGLTREELARCDVLATIPTSESYPAMNLSNATAVMLYDLCRADVAGGWRAAEAAGREKLLLLEDYAARLARALGVPEPRGSEAALALRRAAARAGASRAEVERVIYLLSRALRRVERCEGTANRQPRH